MQYDAMRCGSQGKPITSFGTFIMAIYPGAYVNISESIDDLPAIGKLKVALPFSTHIHTRFVRALRCVWHQEVPLADLSSRRSTALEPITTLRWHSLRCWASCGIRRCSRHSTTQVKVPWCSRCCRARRSMAICRRETSSRRWARARCMIEHRWSDASRTCRVCPTRMASAAPPWRCCMQVSSIVPSTPRGFDDSHTQLPHDRARWTRMLLASIRRTAALLRACRQLGRRYAHCQCTWPVYCRPHACGSLSHTHNRTSKCAWQPRNSLTMACVIRVPCASLRSEVPSQSINHSSLTMCRGTAALTRENRVEMECVLPLYTRQGEILVRIGTAKSDSVVLFSGHPTLIYSYRTRSFIPTDQPTNHLSRSEWSSYCIVHAQCSSPT